MEDIRSSMDDEIALLEADCAERYGVDSICPEAVQLIYDTARAYVCRNVICQPPADDVEKMPDDAEQEDVEQDDLEQNEE